MLQSRTSWITPIQKPGIIYTDNTKEFVKACQELQWNHDTSTLHRSETNGVAERARAESYRKLATETL